MNMFISERPTEYLDEREDGTPGQAQAGPSRVKPKATQFSKVWNSIVDEDNDYEGFGELSMGEKRLKETGDGRANEGHEKGIDQQEKREKREKREKKGKKEKKEKKEWRDKKDKRDKKDMKDKTDKMDKTDAMGKVKEGKVHKKDKKEKTVKKNKMAQSYQQEPDLEDQELIPEPEAVVNSKFFALHDLT
jgi:hypothetical protein